MSPILLQKDGSAKRLLQTLTFLMIPLQAAFHVSSTVPAAELQRACAYSLSLCALCTIALRIVFARWWGIGGVAFAMALSKFCTSSPIQLFKIHGILRANWAPALVVEELSLA
jgi:O-antigen/teichoic acid export membrane protein